MTVSVEDAPVQQKSPDEDRVGPTAPAPKAVDDGYASFEDLLAKKARERDYELKVGPALLKFKLRAIGHLEYDKLVGLAEPTDEQKKLGIRYDDNKLGPLVIAAVVQRPKMDIDRASRLWADPNWAGGEIGALYNACVNLCQAEKVDVSFTGGG